MLSWNYRLVIIICFLFCWSAGKTQHDIFLQIEEINSTELIKYYPGETLSYSTHEYPNTWRKSKIVRIHPEDNLIILEDGYISPEEIHSIRRTNTGVLVFSHSLTTFAAGWLFYGAYATIADSGYSISMGEVVIGVVAAGIGWVVRKLFGKKRYPMKKLYRLRIMDIRFPAPKYETP